MSAMAVIRIPRAGDSVMSHPIPPATPFNGGNIHG